jgi:outer membrane immunogenic protein
MRKLIVGTAALLAFAAMDRASSADLPAPAPAPPPTYAPPPPPPPFSWTGCFIGGGGGYGLWYQNVSGQPAATFNTVTLGGSGWFGTAQVGCDVQFDRFVIGVFGDGDFGSLSGHLFQGSASDINESWAWAAGGRVGWLPMPKLLTYLSAGFTQAHFDQVTATGLGVLFNANTYNGFFLGSGYEYGFGFLPGLFWKTEYRFSSYQAANLPVISGPFGPFNGATAIHVQPYVQTISTELVYRFSWGW